MVLAAFRRIPLPELRSISQPANKTLINFDTIFYTRAEPLTRTVTILGQNVRLEIKPARFVWEHGDGTSVTHRRRRGRRTRRKDIVYRYSDAHVTVDHRVVVTWSAQWSLNGGPLQPVAGTVTTTARPRRCGSPRPAPPSPAADTRSSVRAAPDHLPPITLGYVALAAGRHLAGRSRRPSDAHRARHLTKPLLMPTLAASSGPRPRADSPLRTTTLAAQLGGWGGDLALLRHGTKPFLAGAGSFALGHAAYVTGFLRHARGGPLTRAAARGGSRPDPGHRARDGRAGGPQRRRAGRSPCSGTPRGWAMVATASHLDADLPRSARLLTGLARPVPGLRHVPGHRKFAAPPRRRRADPLIHGRPPLVQGSPRRSDPRHAGQEGPNVSDYPPQTDRPPRTDSPGRPRAVDHVERLVMATYTLAQLLLSQGAARARLAWTSSRPGLGQSEPDPGTANGVEPV